MPDNLPQQLTSFVGREREIAEIRRLLASARLLTLTGPGGCGKTRLALRVASELAGDFEDGVYFVPLASVTDPGLVATTIAQVLGVKEAGGRPLLESLKEHLRDKRMLLLLDNFEQVIGAALAVTDLLAAAPDLKVLVTSRECLRLRGEHEFPVPPLKVQSPTFVGAVREPPLQTSDQSEAVRLFVERATSVKPDFAVTPESALAVAEICYRLDGLPLAIELAAARSKSLTPRAMLARLVGESHGSPLQLLTGGARDLPARQQTLRSAIAWSYDLLDDAERTLFRGLSVFAGGFTLEAARAVCNTDDGRWTMDDGGQSSVILTPSSIVHRPSSVLPLGTDPLNLVSSLVDKSLLAQEEPHAEPRYRMLETIREFALERLSEEGETEETKRRHADYCVALAERTEPALQSPHQLQGLDRLEHEHDNLRAALAWSLERGDATTALRLAGALGWFWSLRGYFSEGGSWLERALALPGASGRTHERAKALNWAGFLAYRQSDSARVRSMLEESVTIWRELDDPGGLAYALTLLGVVVLYQGEQALARDLLEESVALFRGVDDRWGLALSLRNLAEAANAGGDQAGRRALLEESVGIFRQVGDMWGLALALNNLGEAARGRREYRHAAALYDESLALHRQLDHRGPATLPAQKPPTQREAGEYARPDELFEESLALFRQLGDRQGIAWCLAELAGVAATQRRPRKAAQLFGAAESLLEAVDAHLDAVDRAHYDRNVAAARAQLDEAAWNAAWAQGRAMPSEEAVALASPDAPRPSNPREALPELLRVRGPLRGASPTPVPARADLAELTPREIEVLRCLAAGLTDIEAARQLTLSRRTVQSHVRSIFSKLGVTTRGAAARYGLDHGLV